MRPAFSLLVASLLAPILASTLSGCSTLFPADSTDNGPTMAGTCTAATKHVAPGGYYVNGNAICTASGEPHLFHGVDRPSLEFDPQGQQLSPSDFALMASWKANVVRIALNQDYWLQGSPQYNSTYAGTVDDAVHWAEQAGMDVILDLHWSDQGVLGSCDSSCQQVMADMNSITFWSQVAGIYKNDGRVLFELYNEPHDVPWNVWKSGGKTSGGWTAAGMQQLYDAVRKAGADNVVVIGGLAWAQDLTQVPSNRISGYNIAYATHPYNNMAISKTTTAFDANWGFLTKTDPVIVTEFGDGTDCAGTDFTDAVTTYDQSVITYADQHNTSWTAWAWFAGNCTFPALISAWDGTPTLAGTTVKNALAGYSDPSPDGKRDGGAALDAGGAPKPDGGAPAADAATARDGGTAG
jgi:endoglucanase